MQPITSSVHHIRDYSEKNLRKYAELLASRINQSISPSFKKVLIDGMPTKPNHCHDNVTFHLEDNPKCKRINGWLFEEYDTDKKFIVFYAHSIIEDEQGNVVDITLRESANRKFLTSNISEEQFKTLSHELAITSLKHFY